MSWYSSFCTGLVSLRVNQDASVTVGTRTVGHLFTCPSSVSLFLPHFSAPTLTLCFPLMLPCVAFGFEGMLPQVANCRQPFGVCEQIKLKFFLRRLFSLLLSLSFDFLFLPLCDFSLCYHCFFGV